MSTSDKFVQMVIAVAIFYVVIGAILLLTQRLRSRAGERVQTAAFLGPSVLLICIGLLYPAIVTVWQSLHGASSFDPPWVGLDNYKKLFTDKQQLTVLRNTLLWVILVSNAMAMLIQTMSAKLGIATGMNLPEVCRARFSRRTSRGLWVQAELIATAADLAEFIGAALGFNLLFGIPLFWAGVLTGMDYVLGRNALNQSYVTGYGEKASKNQHSRWYANQIDPKLPNPPRGTLAGGPNSQLQDEVEAATDGASSGGVRDFIGLSCSSVYTSTTARSTW